MSAAECASEASSAIKRTSECASELANGRASGLVLLSGLAHSVLAIFCAQRVQCQGPVPSLVVVVVVVVTVVFVFDVSLCKRRERRSDSGPVWSQRATALGFITA